MLRPIGLESFSFIVYLYGIEYSGCNNVTNILSLCFAISVHMWFLNLSSLVCFFSKNIFGLLANIRYIINASI